LSDVYFSKLEINNLTENIRNEIVKRADILREITIGHLAPTFTYIDDEGNQIDLSEIDSKNTILFFYKPDCQKCIREKRILGLIKKRQKDLTILHINISEENYSNVSQDIAVQYDIKTTPTIYILDKDKRITAKNIKAEEIEFHIIKR
jgi:thiol-disulfide isomerase/thioredoxin